MRTRLAHRVDRGTATAVKRALLFLTALTSVLGLAAEARAQDAQVTVAPAPAPTPSALVVAPAPGGAPAKEEKPPEEKDSAHLRMGFGLDGDYMFGPGANSIQGLGVGLQIRIGAQINEWFAAYYQAHAVAGGTISSAGLASKATFIGTVFNSALVEATLPVLHIGAGPSVDVVGVKDFSVLASGDTGATSAYFGIEGRAAIVIGGHGPGHHAGFAINANVHPTFWNGIVLTTFSLGIGGEFY